jgi:hypothetical protein
MFNKANPRILGIVFALLLALVAVSYMGGEDGQRTFKGQLVALKHNEIDRVQIEPSKASGFELVKQDTSWRVETKNGTYRASQQKTGRMLERLTNLEVTQVVANSPEAWENYKVGDTLATRVRIAAGQESAELMIGKLNFSPRSRSAVTYVRQAGDDRVYGVRGMLKRSLAARPNTFRSKMLVDLKPSLVEKMHFTLPGDSSFTLQRDGTQWKVSGEQADSSSVAGYLSQISRLKGSSFAPSVSELDDVSHKLTITAGKEVELSAQKSGGRWIVHSSLLENSYFDDEKGDLHDKLFVGKDHFIK